MLSTQPVTTKEVNMPLPFIIPPTFNPHKGSPSRHNRTLPQHRGVASGGTIPQRQARSPKWGGVKV